MKPLVLLIIILVVLAALFFTGVGVGAFGGDRKVDAKHPPPWLDGLGGMLPGRDPLDPKDIKPSRDGVFNPTTGVLTLGMGGLGTITLGIEPSKSKVRTATISVASGAVSVTFAPKDENDGFAKFSNKRVTKSLDLSIPEHGATLTITSVTPVAVTLKGQKS